MFLHTIIHPSNKVNLFPPSANKKKKKTEKATKNIKKSSKQIKKITCEKLFFAVFLDLPNMYLFFVVVDVDVITSFYIWLLMADKINFFP